MLYFNPGIKRLISKLLYLLIGPFVLWNAKRILSRHNPKSIWIVDIDNTIADTWPSLTRKWSSEFVRLKELQPFDNIKRLIVNLPPETFIVFLSVRSYIFYLVTFNWLKSNGFLSGRELLVLVPWVQAKISYIELGLSQSAEVTYIDDLSYGHEYGEVKFYQNIINTVQAMNVKYIGYSDINSINRSST